MKTLANCSNGEFLTQTHKIASKIKKYRNSIKEAVITEKVKDENGNEKEVQNIDVFKLLDIICDENAHDTLEIGGLFLFMSAEEFAELSPENGEDSFVTIANIFNSERAGVILRIFRKSGAVPENADKD